MRSAPIKPAYRWRSTSYSELSWIDPSRHARQSLKAGRRPRQGEDRAYDRGGFLGRLLWGVRFDEVELEAKQLGITREEYIHQLGRVLH
jgi:hypothetical protein